MPRLYLRGKLLGSFSCIIFDKDGTLINSEKALLELAKSRVKETIKALKILKISNTKLKKTRINLENNYGLKNKRLSPCGSIAIASREQNLISTATILTIIGIEWSKALGIAKNVFSLVDAIQAQQKSTHEKRPNLPGSIKLLRELNRSGFILGLITNDNNKGVKDYLKKNSIKDYFQCCWSSDNFPSKPNPNSIKKLCKMLKVKTSECALISDSDSDLLMAKESNIKLLLGYTGGWSKPPKLYEHDHIIHQWDEINYQ